MLQFFVDKLRETLREKLGPDQPPARAVGEKERTKRLAYMNLLSYFPGMNRSLD